MTGAVAANARSATWWTIGLILVLTAVTVLVFRETAASMAEIWTRSETYRHGWIVLPFAAWLAWRERNEFSAILVKPWWPALPVAAVAGIGWMLAHLASVAALEHFAFVLMLQIGIVGAIGRELARRFWFPIVFLVFAVPVGEALVPMLMDRTADFVVISLRSTGIPVYREGNYFIIPSGSWSVVEACSGIRYLLVSVMAGTLYAYLTYRSAWRRTAFIAVSFIVPIVANWMRAYLIVILGHVSDNKLAAGVDHLIYGAIFFGIIMALLFWIGSRWREDSAPAAPRAREESDRQSSSQRSGTLTFAVAFAALIAAVSAFADRVDSPSADVVPVLRSVPPADGWNPTDQPISVWAPKFVGERALHRQSFIKSGRQVDVVIAYYRAQTQGRELVSYENALVSTSDTQWRELSRGEATLPVSGTSLSVPTTSVLIGARQLLVARWYQVGTRVTGSDVLAKAYLALQKLFDSTDDGAAIVISTESSDVPADAEATLADFMRSIGPGIEQTLRGARPGAMER